LERKKPCLQKQRILCIDDHWNGLIGRKMLLEENGYKVLEATGPEYSVTKNLFTIHVTFRA